MSIERILFATKFRELSFNSVEALFPLKEAGLKEIVFCNVISREDVGFVPFGGYLKDEEEKLKEEARIRFEDWQQSMASSGIDSRIVISIGEPVPKILHTSEDEKVDLLVVGQKKKDHLEDFFAGSLTMQILTRSKVPCLVSKYMVRYEIDGEHHERLNNQLFESPMLVEDRSEQSQHALNLLASFKGVVKKAIVFHNFDIKTARKHDKDELHDEEEKSRKRLHACCELLNANGIETESHLGAGDTLEETLRISREQQASMIIAGTSGKARLQELLHKSVSHEIARKSELPTLLVP